VPKTDAALAVAIPNLPAPGSTITQREAVQIALQVNAVELNRLKTEQAQNVTPADGEGDDE